MSATCSRGKDLARGMTTLFVVLTVASLLTFVVQVVIAAFGGGAPDSGWAGLALVSGAMTFWSRSGSGFQQLLAASGDASHRSRSQAVWWLLVGGVVLVMGLKLSSSDVDAYKNLVFGEGGLVEWTQVILLVASVRAAWLIGADLRRRLGDSLPVLVIRGCSLLLGLVLLEELAWGQVIFGWRTPEMLREINAQNETTLHNIDWFQDRLDAGYFLVTLVLLIAVLLAPWLMRTLLQKASDSMAVVLRALTPATYIWPMFVAVAALALCIATRTFSEVIVNRDQEWGELLLYASVLILLLRARVLLGSVQDAP